MRKRALNGANRLRLWEVALLVGMAFALLTAGWAEGTQSRLASGVLRLHVVASSDSEGDQALKLRVRDAVLAVTEPILTGCTSRTDAEAALTAHLPEIQAAAETAAEGEPVSVTLEDTWFPTKEYEGFALPCGSYRALRVVIGAGAGHNWWCVVYPALCLGASADLTEEEVQTAMTSAGMSQEDAELVTENDGYILKFKVVELWESLRAWWS
ncbi:MAG: stage II sporulation protein R [Oscillospiraceae bacterium]|nr:stage II sporulation protein R [Oscillospiraceae bacterium]